MVLGMGGAMEILDELVARIRKVVQPERIVLFGSRARGTASPESDFDILVIAPSTLPRWRRTVPLYRVLAGVGISYDLVWWTSEEIEEWRNVQSHFITTVLREGKVLYERPS
ncbi:MAG: nucleotidyltransferase domain-containing protein [Planctomycetota bacterium]